LGNPKKPRCNREGEPGKGKFYPKKNREHTARVEKEGDHRLKRKTGRKKQKDKHVRNSSTEQKKHAERN